MCSPAILSKTSAQVIVAALLLFHWPLLLGAQERFNVAGGEIAGNVDGSIPAWKSKTDGPLPGWNEGASRISYSPYASEKPIFVVNKKNLDKYVHILPAGAIALLKGKPGYTMPVYPTHRSCSMPQFVADNTIRNEGRARIASNGWSIENVILPSIPFRHPRTGIEALWNFLLRYQSVGIELKNNNVYLSPYKEGADAILYNAESRIYYPWATLEENKIQAGDLKQGIQILTKEPLSLKGQVIFQRFYFNKAPDSYYFHPEQRRVRRMPSYSYDAPVIGFERTYPNDAFGIFSGNPDRFEWELKGKRELLIPYNGLNFTDKDANGNSIFGRDYVVESVRRYELHRVWVIEGTLRSGMRHSTPRKVLYLDEDSWAAVAGEDYDADGKLVRYKEAGVVPIWEINACTSILSMILYDFVQNRYLRDGYLTDEKDLKFYIDTKAPWLRDEEFTEMALRRKTN